MKINLTWANPSGNITLLVETPVNMFDRPKIAYKLMQHNKLRAEQVGFIAKPIYGGEGRLEMAGGEFCGNALRSFGLLLAKRRGRGGCVLVEISGHSGIVAIETDIYNQTASAEMPLPNEIKPIVCGAEKGSLVSMDGIMHAVIHHAPEEAIANSVMENIIGSSQAYGVMFLEHDGRKLTPFVFVPASDTRVWEGSCGSGSVAAAVVLSQPIHNGRTENTFIQPGGSLTVTVEKRDGLTIRAVLTGVIELKHCDNIEIIWS